MLKVAEPEKQSALIILDEDENENLLKVQNELNPLNAINHTKITSLNNSTKSFTQSYKGVKVTLRNFGQTVPVANTNPSKACLLS
jgi:hypothetical protein